jgi:hypothetical protein
LAGFKIRKKLEKRRTGFKMRARERVLGSSRFKKFKVQDKEKGTSHGLGARNACPVR